MKLYGFAPSAVAAFFVAIAGWGGQLDQPTEGAVLQVTADSHYERPATPITLISVAEARPLEIEQDYHPVVQPTSPAIYVSEPSVPVSPILTRTIEVNKGDTLMALLTNSSVPREKAQNAISALQRYYNPRNLKPGQDVTLVFEKSDGNKSRDFIGLNLEKDPLNMIMVSLKSDGLYQAAEVQKEISVKTVAAAGTVTSSLFKAGREAKVPFSTMASLIHAYSWNVDFQRDIHRGDDFKVMYEVGTTADGHVVKSGDPIYASLSVGGKKINIYRFLRSDGTTGYFEENGNSIKQALLRTPIDGARISSRYGMRRHPILGYSKMHKGVDFAAPSGTPIYAAGDGTIESAGRNGGYGKYVRIRHNNNIKTAYAHLSRYGKNIKSGRTVRQGTIIGYVGTTGRSTGPHLHYEVLRGRRQVNPVSIKLASRRQLDPEEEARFHRHVRYLKQKWETLHQEPTYFAQR